MEPPAGESKASGSSSSSQQPQQQFKFNAQLKIPSNKETLAVGTWALLCIPGCMVRIVANDTRVQFATLPETKQQNESRRQILQRLLESEPEASKCVVKQLSRAWNHAVADQFYERQCDWLLGKQQEATAAPAIKVESHRIHFQTKLHAADVAMDHTTADMRRAWHILDVTVCVPFQWSIQSKPSVLKQAEDLIRNANTVELAAMQIYVQGALESRADYVAPAGYATPPSAPSARPPSTRKRKRAKIVSNVKQS